MGLDMDKLAESWIFFQVFLNSLVSFLWVDVNVLLLLLWNCSSIQLKFAESANECEMAAGDVNLDGQIDIVDIISVRGVH